MGSGFKSRGVHYRSPVLIGHKPEGGVSLCPESHYKGYLRAIYFSQRCT